LRVGVNTKTGEEVAIKLVLAFQIRLIGASKDKVPLAILRCQALQDFRWFR